MLVRKAFLTVLALLVSFAPAFAAEITFDEPDERALPILETLEEQIHENFDEDWALYSRRAHYDTAWVDVTGEAAAALFVLPIHLCGASNCTIIGFENRDGEWVKIYEQFGGEGIIVLDTQTKGYFDIVQYATHGASRGVGKTSRWDGQKYGEPTLKNFPEDE